MKFLIDTHILIWAVYEKAKLSTTAKTILQDKNNEIYYSILSIFEIELKRSSHPEQIPITSERIMALADEIGFLQMPLKIEHILEFNKLKRPDNVPPHKDPFDKLIVCQSIAEKIFFLTHDSRIAEYDTPNIYKV